MLVAGLCLLGLFAWIFSSGGGTPTSPPAKSTQAAGILPAAKIGENRWAAMLNMASGPGAPGSASAR